MAFKMLIIGVPTFAASRLRRGKPSHPPSRLRRYGAAGPRSLAASHLRTFAPSHRRTPAPSIPPYTGGMALDITAVQRALQAERLDGWLLYDFHGSNPIAQRLAGLGAATT